MAAIKDYSPRKISYYPIPGDLKGGALFIYGDANAANMALMSAGFPDDHEAFMPFASRLAKETDTLVGVTCLPGYDDREDKPWTDHKRDRKYGYSFDDMASCFREAAKALRAESSLPSKAKFTGIFHDWGVVPGSIWSNRAIADGSDNAPDEIVYFDVLMNPHPSTVDLPKGNDDLSVMQKCYKTLYMIVFASAFAAQTYVCGIFGIITLSLLMILLGLFRLGPCYKIDDDVMQSKSPPMAISRCMYMSYVYFNIFCQLSLKKIWNSEFHEDSTLPKDLSTVPVLYLYGKHKRSYWHKDSSIKFLQREHEEKRSKSNSIGVEGAGHWLYIQKPDICFDHVVNFMKEK